MNTSPLTVRTVYATVRSTPSDLATLKNTWPEDVAELRRLLLFMVGQGHLRVEEDRFVVRPEPVVGREAWIQQLDASWIQQLDARYQVVWFDLDIGRVRLVEIGTTRDFNLDVPWLIVHETKRARDKGFAEWQKRKQCEVALRRTINQLRDQADAIALNCVRGNDERNPLVEEYGVLLEQRTQLERQLFGMVGVPLESWWKG